MDDCYPIHSYMQGTCLSSPQLTLSFNNTFSCYVIRCNVEEYLVSCLVLVARTANILQYCDLFVAYILNKLTKITEATMCLVDTRKSYLVELCVISSVHLCIEYTLALFMP